MGVVREVMVHAGGVATTRQLLEVVTRRTLDAALARGEVVRVERGRFAVPEVPAARAAAHRLGGVLALTSAALEWGWAVKTVPERPIVAVDPARNIAPARRADVSVTWRALSESDIAFGRHTSALRTITDCAASLPFDEALAVADSALRSGLVSPGDLQVAAAAHPWRGRARVHRVAGLASGRSANPFESTLRAIAVAATDVVWVPQFPVRVGSTTLHPDVCCPGLRIALEADSFEFHGKRPALVADCWRYDELTVAGWLVLRFAWEQVMFQPEWVASMVSRAVRRRAA